MNKLFQKITLGDITLKNKIVMAPMTRNRATADGIPTQLMAKYYGQRASAGLIITEGIQPNIVGQGFLNTPGLYNNKQVEAWKQVTESVHNSGGRIVAQLMHSGRIGHPLLNLEGLTPFSPSAIAAKGETFTPDGMKSYPIPRELTLPEIEQTIVDFTHAAKNAIDAGFDGVEIHAGNGFLLHQFIADSVNQRSDKYGGSIDARNRFVIDVTEAICNTIGSKRTGIRISPQNPYNDVKESQPLEQYTHLINKLPELAYLHIMEAGNREQTHIIRQQWKGSLILNPHSTESSGFTTPEVANLVIEEELADAVCFGMLFISNPDLVMRVKTGATLNEADESTFYGGDHKGYTDYKTLS